MAYDLVIKNGLVVDGSGLPRTRADVAVKGSRIVAVGKVTETGGHVIDAEGLVVAPGIVDVHTHYDAQLFWDPLATCSCWHGVTTVVTGNCGYTLAPCRPEDRDYLTRTFAKVEGISLRALEQGLPWTWVGFPEFLDTLDRRLGINVVPYIGHTAVRRFAMGEASIERAATADELLHMQRIVREAMEAGAAGFTTSLSPLAVGWYEEPLPSTLADYDEVFELASAVGESGVGTIGILPRTVLQGVTPDERQEILRLGAGTRRPLILQITGRMLEDVSQAGIAAYTLINARPLDRVFNLLRTSVLDGMPNWRALIAKPREEKAVLMRDESFRAALRHDIDHPNIDPERGELVRPFKWEAASVLRVRRDENRLLEGQSIPAFARKQNKHIADALLDLVLEEDLETQFRYSVPWSPERRQEIAAQLRSPYALLGTSDGGAHLDRDDGAEYSSLFIRQFVKEHRLVTLEEAVRLLTFVPASVIGLWDRGLLRPGYAADIMVFDPDGLGVASKDWVSSLPGGDMRFGALSQGFKYTIVNGQILTTDGERHTGAFPGRVLRLHPRSAAGSSGKQWRRRPVTRREKR